MSTIIHCLSLFSKGQIGGRWLPAADEWLAGRLAALPSTVWNRPKRQSRLRAVFQFQSASLPENRILGGPCGTVWIGWRNYPPKGRKPVRGAKESFLGAKDGQRVERNQRRPEANRFHRRAIPARIGEIRMRIRMRFCFRRAEEASIPTGSKAKAGFQ